jgi:hypothetical protein
MGNREAAPGDYWLIYETEGIVIKLFVASELMSYDPEGCLMDWCKV